ncbi:hypothetical protein [Streptomyces olivochromogenes]|uniref:hypothetical protein n=1 Tax=Streptomyces olivochromogenes TaxID=1963 RepID=UPI003675EF21
MESGRVLDRRYKLESPLGRGAQGSVWLGLDLVLNRPVAVKVATLHRHPGQGEHSEELNRRVERFRKEAQAMARVQNRPHVAVIHDHGEDGDILYSVMEYIEGRPLSAHTGQGRRARLTGESGDSRGAAALCQRLGQDCARLLGPDHHRVFEACREASRWKEGTG